MTDSWARAFDPNENLRALGEIQRRGFDAARALVDRFVEALGDDHVETTAGETGPADGDAPSDGPFNAWVQLMGRSMEALTGALKTAGSARDRVHVVIDRQADGPTLRGCSVVWVHNTTEREIGGLRPHCGELRSSSGTVLACDVTFEPATIGRLAAAATEPVLMRVTGVDRMTPGGTYRGIVQIAGLADTVLAVDCEITG